MSSKIKLYQDLVEISAFYLSKLAVGSDGYAQINEGIEETKSALHSLINTELSACKLMFTPAHLKLMAALKNDFKANPNDDLIRLATVLAYLSCTFSDLFRKEDYQEFSKYFPTIKLPFFVSKEDVSTYSNFQYRDVKIQSFLTNILEDFKTDPKSKTKETFRSVLWAPLIKTFFDSIKEYDEISELHIVADYYLHKDLEFIDMAAVSKGHDGLPILLIQILTGPNSEISYYKAFRKLAISIVFTLMEAIQRAEISCANEDFSKFRSYGIIISETTFEFCVGTVSKDSKGRINFMIHSNSNYWKFSLDSKGIFQSEEERIAADSCVCGGEISIFKPAEERIEDDNEINTDLFVAIGDASDADDINGETEFTEVQIDSLNIEPQLIIWKYLKEVVNYYKNLPQVLKDCFKKKPIKDPQHSSRYKFVSKCLLPENALSNLKHKKQPAKTKTKKINFEITASSDIVLDYYDKTLRLLSDSGIGEQSIKLAPKTHISVYTIKSDAILKFYENLLDCRIPNLPNVLTIEPETRKVTLIESLSGICEYLVQLELDEYTKIDTSTLCCLSAKFILDMLIAAYHIHKHNLVCGGFIDLFIRYDGTFWYINSLNNIHDEGIVSDKAFMEPIYHLDPPHRYTQMDDLYGIIQTFMFCFHGYYRHVIYQSSAYPLFEPFVAATYNKMINIKDHPEVTAESILLDAIPSFMVLLDGSKITVDSKPLIATKMVAKKVLNEINATKGH